MSTKKVPQRKNALGKGLSALLKDSLFLVEEKGLSVVQEIPIGQIRVNPLQPRKDFGAAALQELCESIRSHGIIQPLTVRKLFPSAYQLIAGERRFQAAKQAGLKKLPAYIRAADNHQMLEMALVENIQREDLNPIEIAVSYQRLLDECQIKQEVLSARVGKDRTTVNNYLRLLKLPADIQVAVRDRKISMGHARALVGVKAVEDQLGIFQSILQKDLSVRRTEVLARVRNLEKVSEAVRPKQAAINLNSRAREASARLATDLCTQVKIQIESEEKGTIKIAFAGLQDLDRILKKLVSVE